jgi:hypothetical protein
MLCALLAGCASASHPRMYGSYNELMPKIAPTKGERIPQHVTVTLKQPANVALFYVVPGRPSQLVYPVDSTQSAAMDAGSHLIETSFTRRTLSDTSRIVRLPGSAGVVPPGARTPQNGRNGRVGAGRDTSMFGGTGIATHGYLLLYASQQPLPYSILSTRVNGISVPIEDTDALNTVTKLVRETTHTTGTWAAYATDFPP